MSAVVVGNATATSPGLVQLAQDFSGSAQAPTIAAVTGAAPIAITPNELQWVTGATPLIDQAAQGSDLATQTLTLQSQAPFGSATVNKAAGNVDLNIPASVSGNVYGLVRIKYNSTPIWQAAPYPGLPGNGCLYSGGVTPGTTNYLFYVNAAGTNNGINAASGGFISIGIAGNNTIGINANCLSVGSSITPSTGGGIGVLVVQNASTAPSSNPSGGGVIYENAGSLTHRGSSGTVTSIAPA